MRDGGPVVGRWLGDREVVGSNPARAIVNFLEQEIYLTLLHSTQVFKWVPVRAELDYVLE